MERQLPIDRKRKIVKSELRPSLKHPHEYIRVDLLPPYYNDDDIINDDDLAHWEK